MKETCLQRETIDAIREDGFEPLLRQHWKEVAHDQELIPLDIDWDGYRAQERAGTLVVFAMRRGEELVGYNAFFINRSMHYRNHIFAVNDVIYLRPGERGIDGLWMILKSEELLKALGAVKVFYHTKADAIMGTKATDSLEAVEHLVELEERVGYKLPDALEHVATNTLSDCLVALGYAHVENNMGKLLIGGR